MSTRPSRRGIETIRTCKKFSRLGCCQRASRPAILTQRQKHTIVKLWKPSKGYLGSFRRCLFLNTISDLPSGYKGGTKRLSGNTRRRIITEAETIRLPTGRFPWIYESNSRVCNEPGTSTTRHIECCARQRSDRRWACASLMRRNLKRETACWKKLWRLHTQTLKLFRVTVGPGHHKTGNTLCEDRMPSSPQTRLQLVLCELRRNYWQDWRG